LSIAGIGRHPIWFCHGRDQIRREVCVVDHGLSYWVIGERDSDSRPQRADDYPPLLYSVIVMIRLRSLANSLVVSQPEYVRVLQIVLVGFGVLFFVLSIFRLNVRQIDRTGLCGSVLQGSRYDDGGSNTPACNRLRHDDRVAAASFVILGVGAFGLGVGLILYARNR
jgi:hypothetical protein